MRTGAAVIASAAFGGIGAGLAAILFSGGYGTGAIRVGATFLGSFWHDGLLQTGIGIKMEHLSMPSRRMAVPGYSVSNHPWVPSALTLKTEGSTIIKSAVRIGGKL